MAKKLEKKAKVEPVQGSKVKKQKMALAKQLKSMSIGTSGAAKKDAIHRKDSSSSEDEEGANSDMEVDQVGNSAPKVSFGSVSKPIKKYVQKTPKMSRATYLEMKKQAKRLAKSGQ